MIKIILMPKQKKNYKSSFSENLKRMRKERGLSQYDLADLTGISQQMIAHYETKVADPPLDKMELISNALNIEISELLYKKDIAQANTIDISKFDTRSLKKLQDILSLPANDRADLYRMLNKMIKKNQLEREKQLSESKK